MRIHQLFVFLLFLFLWQTADAQVVNDDLANRLPLSLNAPLLSSTVDCTVEWNCLNQSLTRSCVKYHNDQWFSLEVPENKPYFLNVSSQECRDIWGVQVLVFSGEPCNPSTYELLACHSDGNTDDIFIRLTALQPGREYLVNVDGYLHDQCTFSLELSDVPKGLPVITDPETVASLSTSRREVRLTWELTAEMAGSMEHFEIYRSEGEGQPFELLQRLPHQRNAFGEGRLRYTFSDTLNQTRAEYKVVGQAAGDRLLLLHEQVSLDPGLIRDAPENNLVLEMEYPDGLEIGLLVYEAESDSVLFSDEFVFHAPSDRKRRYYIREYILQGIHRYRVVMIRKDTWEREEILVEK